MASNFFVAFRILSPPRRAAIESVYAFCRRADDAADEAPDAAQGRAALDEVRSQLDAAFAGGAPGIPGLAAAIANFGLPRRPFDDLIEGVSWDLEGRRYATREALREYCYRVASTVGLLCVRIFGCDDGTCDRYAEETGIALQWTNILRDIAPDLAQGRLYLPAESLRAHGLAEVDLRSPSLAARERIAALVRDEAAFARARFAAAAEQLPRAQRSRVLAGEIMAEVYRVILGKVERRGAGVLEARVRVSLPRRAWLAGRLVLRERLSRAGAE
jgi:phytoene synthase